MNGTGYAMLFSAGTFLYVATVHILPELMSRKPNNNDLIANHEHNKMTKKELLFLVIGILTPLFLGLSHHH